MLNLPSLEEKQQTKEELKVANNQPGPLELEFTSDIVIANNQPGSLGQMFWHFYTMYLTTVHRSSSKFS